MVCSLSTGDLDALLPLAPMFWAEGKLPGRFESEVFKRTWTKFIEMGLGHILGYSGGNRFLGALGFVLAPDPNDGALLAHEMFWFVEPESRGVGMRLLRAYEEKAKDLGAERLVMVHLSSANAPELKRIYERRGYREIETHYMKETL